MAYTSSSSLASPKPTMRSPSRWAPMSYSVVRPLALVMASRPSVLPTIKGRNQRTLPATGLTCSPRRVMVVMLLSSTGLSQGRRVVATPAGPLSFRSLFHRWGGVDPGQHGLPLADELAHVLGRVLFAALTDELAGVGQVDAHGVAGVAALDARQRREAAADGLARGFQGQGEGGGHRWDSIAG